MTNILKYLFPVPKDESKRVVTFANNEDYISFRFVLTCLLLMSMVVANHTARN